MSTIEPSLDLLRLCGGPWFLLSCELICIAFTQNKKKYLKCNYFVFLIKMIQEVNEEKNRKAKMFTQGLQGSGKSMNLSGYGMSEVSSSFGFSFQKLRILQNHCLFSSFVVPPTGHPSRCEAFLDDFTSPALSIEIVCRISKDSSCGGYTVFVNSKIHKCLGTPCFWRWNLKNFLNSRHFWDLTGQIGNFKHSNNKN